MVLESVLFTLPNPLVNLAIASICAEVIPAVFDMFVFATSAPLANVLEATEEPPVALAAAGVAADIC
jgi:hypothetical protein